MCSKTRIQISTLIAMLAVGTLQTASALADESWKPFFQDKDGKTKPFPEEAKKIKDKEWLQIQYTEFTGMKPRVGVTLDENKNTYSAEWDQLLSDIYGTGTNPYYHIEDIVRQALSSTHRFTMVERGSAKDDVIEEQNMAASGRMDSKTAAPTGKIKGAAYLVKATVIELDREKDTKDIQAVGGGLTSNALGIGSVGVSGKVAFCRLNVRFVNSATGEIVKEMTVDGTADSKGVSVGGGVIGFGSKMFGGGGGSVKSNKKAPLSDAMQACANKIAYAVALGFEDMAWSGSVSKADAGSIFINGGTNVGLLVGQTLDVASKGEEIVDADTGESLGAELSRIGVIRVIEVNEKYSKCEVVDGCEGVKAGDIVTVKKESK